MDTKRGQQAVLVKCTEILGIALCLAGALGHWSGVLGNLSAQAQAVQTQAGTETGCRQTHSTTGVYAQPSLESPSRGILSSGQTVRLELVGAGTGWARVTAPVIGWVEAKYLTPASVCTDIAPATTTQPSALLPTGPQPTAQPAAALPVAVCDVLPTEGLVVRSEPTMAPSTALYTIPKGTHQFQFTSDHLTAHSSNNIERHWAYITAPYPGWISIGVVGGSSNLGGKECG